MAYLANGFQLGHPSMSPDGRWMAYDTDESGRLEVYVQSFPDPTKGRFQVSSDGGTEPTWSKGGREIAFRKGDSVMVAAFEAQTGKVGKPAILFVGPFDNAPDYSEPRSYDVTPDGQRFAMVREVEQPPARVSEMVLVQNWIEELKRLVPTH